MASRRYGERQMASCGDARPGRGAAPPCSGAKDRGKAIGQGWPAASRGGLSWGLSGGASSTPTRHRRLLSARRRLAAHAGTGIPGTEPYILLGAGGGDEFARLFLHAPARANPGTFRRAGRRNRTASGWPGAINSSPTLQACALEAQTTGLAGVMRAMPLAFPMTRSPGASSTFQYMLGLPLLRCAGPSSRAGKIRFYPPPDAGSTFGNAAKQGRGCSSAKCPSTGSRPSGAKGRWLRVRPAVQHTGELRKRAWTRKHGGRSGEHKDRNHASGAGFVNRLEVDTPQGVKAIRYRVKLGGTSEKGVPAQFFLDSAITSGKSNTGHGVPTLTA